MILYIDTTDNQKTIVKLDSHQLIKTYTSPRDQNLLSSIQELLSQQKVSPSQISAIKVNPGPGSFTGTRIGVAVANALAFALGIKVNDQTPPISPTYSQPPTITTPKNK